jgi:hypothetical protein
MKDSTREGLERYANERIYTGDFLYAVLTNDLFGAVGRADEENQRDIVEICSYVYNELPAGCWGSEEKVGKWLAELTFEGDSVKVKAGRVGLMCSKCLDAISRKKSTKLIVDIKMEEDDEAKSKGKSRKGKSCKG